MINTLKLKAKIVERGYNYQTMAEIMGLSACTFGKKMRGAATMTVVEAEQMIKILEIPKDEVVEYFFMDD